MHCFKILPSKPGLLVQAYNPTFPGGQSWKEMSSRPAWVTHGDSILRYKMNT